MRTTLILWVFCVICRLNIVCCQNEKVAISQMLGPFVRAVKRATINLFSHLQVPNRIVELLEQYIYLWMSRVIDLH